MFPPTHRALLLAILAALCLPLPARAQLSGFVAKAISTQEVVLCWHPAPGATFTIERSADGATGWTTLGSAGTGARSWQDATVVPGETFHYRLTAPGVGTATAIAVVPPRDGLAGAVVSGSALDLWQPGTVRAVAAQSDGKWIVGGSFTRAKGSVATNLVRLNGDGTVDPTFNASPNDTVLAMAVQPDGKIVIGGSFTHIGSTPVPNVARLLADGALDTAFQADVGSGASSAIRALALTQDGRVIVGGGTPSAAYLHRLNTNGARDSNFSHVFGVPTFGAPVGVQAVVVQNDGKILVGGDFATVDGVATQVARFNTDGSIDTTFASVAIDSLSNVQPYVRSVAVQPDGKIIIGGYFRFGFAANIARLHADGSYDPTFGARSAGSISAVAMLSANRIGVAGFYNSTAGLVRRGWTTIDVNGADFGGPQFFISGVYAIATSADGRVLVGGRFSRAGNADHQSLAVLNPGGVTLDPTFSGSVSAPGSATAMAVRPDGRVIVSGLFTSIGGPESVGFRRHCIARIAGDNMPEGEIGIAADFFGSTASVAEGSDGRVWVGAEAGVSVSPNVTGQSLLRFHSSGALESVARPSGGVRVLLPDANGGAAIAGSFLQVDGSPRAGIAHIRADGSLSASDFAVGLVNGSVNGFARQSDEKRLVSGSYEMIMAQPRRYLTRVLPGGTTLDSGFNPAPNAACGNVFSNQHGIWVAGSFTTIGGATRPGLARLLDDGAADPSFVPAVGGNLLAVDGERCILSGELSGFVPGRTLRMVRLQPGGAYDPAFDIGSAPSTNPTDALIAGDTMLVGGTFTSFGGQPRQGLVRVRLGSTLTPPSAPDALAVTATTSTSATLGWSAVAGVGGYLIEHRATGAAAWQIAGVTDGGAAAFTDAALPPGSAWQFRVSAFNAAGPSSPSSSAAAVLPSTYTQWRTEWSIPSDTAHDADLDADGLALLAEYATALAPNAADAEALATVSTVAGRLTLTYLRARTDIAYLVEASSDLASWSAAGVDQGGPGPWVTASIAIGPAPTFLRLRFTLVP